MRSGRPRLSWRPAGSCPGPGPRGTPRPRAARSGRPTVCVTPADGPRATPLATVTHMYRRPPVHDRTGPWLTSHQRPPRRPPVACITDAHLAALAIEHGVAIASADTDFARFT